MDYHFFYSIINMLSRFYKMRIIDKLPNVPNFTEKSIRMISDLLFVSDKPFDNNKQNSKSALQIIGNIAFLKDMLKDNIFSKVSNNYNIIPRLIISGGINPEYKQNTEETRLVQTLYTQSGKYDWQEVLTTPESVIINNRLQKMLYNPWHNERKPLLETKSTNAKDNIAMVDKIGGYNEIEQLRLFTTAESSLRVIAIARNQLPKLKNIASISYVPTFPELGAVCDKQNWAKHPLAQRYVYGELLRVIKYNETEEIRLTYAEKQKLRNIVRELNMRQH